MSGPDDREVLLALETIGELSGWLTWADGTLRHWREHGDTTMWDGNDAARLVEQIGRVRDAREGIKRDDKRQHEKQRRTAVLRAINEVAHLSSPEYREARTARPPRVAGPPPIPGPMCVQAVSARVREAHPDLADRLLDPNVEDTLLLALDAWDAPEANAGGRGISRWKPVGDLMALLGIGGSDETLRADARAVRKETR